MRIIRDYSAASDPDQNRQFRRMWIEPPGRIWPDYAVGFRQPGRRFVSHAADVIGPRRTEMGASR